MTDEDWLAEQSAGAPGPLRERAAEYLAVGRSDGQAVNPRGQLSADLARAARVALQTVLDHPAKGDRSVALDLLTADALVTLALKAKAEEDPGELARFAAELRSRDLGSGVRGQ